MKKIYELFVLGNEYSTSPFDFLVFDSVAEAEAYRDSGDCAYMRLEVYTLDKGMELFESNVVNEDL